MRNVFLKQQGNGKKAEYVSRFFSDVDFDALLDSEPLTADERFVMENPEVAVAREVFQEYCHDYRTIQGQTKDKKVRQKLIDRYLNTPWMADWELNRLFADGDIPNPGKKADEMARWKCYCKLSVHAWWDKASRFGAIHKDIDPYDSEDCYTESVEVPISSTYKVIRDRTFVDGEPYTDIFYLSRGDERSQILQAVFLSWIEEDIPLEEFREQLEQSPEFKNIVTPRIKPRRNDVKFSANMVDVEEKLLRAYLPVTPSVVRYTLKRCLQEKPSDIVSIDQPRRGVLVISFISQPSTIGGDPARAIERKQQLEAQGKSGALDARWRIYTVRESDGRWTSGRILMKANKAESEHRSKFSRLSKLKIVDEHQEIIVGSKISLEKQNLIKTYEQEKDMSFERLDKLREDFWELSKEEALIDLKRSYGEDVDKHIGGPFSKHTIFMKVNQEGEEEGSGTYYDKSLDALRGILNLWHIPYPKKGKNNLRK